MLQESYKSCLNYSYSCTVVSTWLSTKFPFNFIPNWRGEEGERSRLVVLPYHLQGITSPCNVIEVDATIHRGIGSRLQEVCNPGISKVKCKRH